MSETSVKPIFVIGAPRSGTTMLGNYLGSARSILNAGEYRALYLTFGALPNQLAEKLSGLVPAEWEPFRMRYIAELQRHARDFIVRAAEESGCTGFCDSSPRNALITDILASVFPEALFVLSLRHYSGVIQSILRLGMIRLLPGGEPALDWIEPTPNAAGQVWSRHYLGALAAPPDRTIVFDYDAFCKQPETVLTELKAQLAVEGFPVHELDDGVLSISHAQAPGEVRRTVMGSGLERRLSPIPSFDPSSWTDEMERSVQLVVRETDAMLRDAFPTVYVIPDGFERFAGARA